MIVDCHQHYHPDILTPETLIAQMEQTGIDRVALMPAICGAIQIPSPFIISAMRYSLKKTTLRPLVRKIITRFTDEGDFKLPSSVIRIIKTPDNASVFDLADRYPGRFFAWCMINPQGGTDPVRELDTWKTHAAFAGVKAHPFWHRFPLKQLDGIAESLVAINAPLILHLGFGDHGDIVSLVNRFPRLIVILAHAAFPNFKDTWKQIKGLKNIFVDLSATSYVDEKTMTEVTSYLGIERCLFGTDGPFGSHNSHGGFDLGLIKRKIENVFPDRTHQQLILGENFMNIVGGIKRDRSAA